MLIFSKSGLVLMLESADSNSLYIVSPFMGTIIDRGFGNVLISPATRAFSKFVDFVKFICRLNCVSVWTESDPEKLKEDIYNFIDIGRSTFGTY